MKLILWHFGSILLRIGLWIAVCSIATFCAMVIGEKIWRIVKRRRGEFMDWTDVESQLALHKGTLVYIGSGPMGRVWWTAEDVTQNSPVDAIADALLVDCPRRYRNPSRLREDFPHARVCEFSGNFL